MPKDWIAYDPLAIQRELVDAKASILALTGIPYQRSWAEGLQKIQLKREVAGTSRIEGAEFTEKELDAAMAESPEQLETRSQRQAAAAVATYRWIARLPNDRPVDADLIREVHRRLVTGCDDDHCPPGKLRGPDDNVTFGAPPHRGAEGGRECAEAFQRVVEAVRTVFTEHDPLIQALALHYHFAAMHPFLDGNGRTARALEALMLQRMGLRDTLFIAMSNYYYEEKTAYLKALGDVRVANHDLTSLLKFALAGVAKQCQRLFGEIRRETAKVLFRSTVTDLFGRLKSPKRRVMTERQAKLLCMLLDQGDLPYAKLQTLALPFYKLENPVKALRRDLDELHALRAIRATLGVIPATKTENSREVLIGVDLEWPMKITETEFFAEAKKLPKGKKHGFLSS